LLTMNVSSSVVRIVAGAVSARCEGIRQSRHVMRRTKPPTYSNEIMR